MKQIQEDFFKLYQDAADQIPELNLTEETIAFDVRDAMKAFQAVMEELDTKTDVMCQMLDA